MSAVRNVVLKLFHLLAAIHFIYAVYYEIVHILPEEIPLRGYSFGGKFVYLTILNVVSDARRVATYNVATNTLIKCILLCNYYSVYSNYVLHHRVRERLDWHQRERLEGTTFDPARQGFHFCVLGLSFVHNGRFPVLVAVCC